MSETKSDPTIRVRLQHTHTLKDGWRLSETTVEWSGDGHPAWRTIADVLGEAHEHGTDEADRRNRAEREAVS